MKSNKNKSKECMRNGWNYSKNEEWKMRIEWVNGKMNEERKWYEEVVENGYEEKDKLLEWK
jgi:hypothetical protein